MTAGNTPKGRSQSLLAVWTQITSAMGSPQNNADNPRANRPRELSSSGCGLDSGTPRASDGEVGVFLKSTLIVVQQPHRFGRFELVRLDGLVDLRLHLALQLRFVILHGGKRLDDRRSFNHFLDVITSPLIRIEEDMDLVHASEKIVQIPH